MSAEECVFHSQLDCHSRCWLIRPLEVVFGGVKWESVDGVSRGDHAAPREVADPKLH